MFLCKCASFVTGYMCFWCHFPLKYSMTFHIFQNLLICLRPKSYRNRRTNPSKLLRSHENKCLWYFCALAALIGSIRMGFGVIFSLFTTRKSSVPSLWETILLKVYLGDKLIFGSNRWLICVVYVLCKHDKAIGCCHTLLFHLEKSSST